MLTNQLVYEMVRAHFADPKNERGYVKRDDGIGGVHGMCVYRGKTPDGRECSCAFGCLIPPALYSPLMENKLVDDLLLPRENWAEEYEGEDVRIEEDPSFWSKIEALQQMFEEVDHNLLTELQRAHDDATGHDWRPVAIEGFDDAAAQFHLEVVSAQQ